MKTGDTVRSAKRKAEAQQAREKKAEVKAAARTRLPRRRNPKEKKMSKPHRRG